MKFSLLTGVVGAILFCSALIVSAAVTEPKDAKCPVSGKGCDPDVSAAFAGGKVWFCCGKCEAAFKADSAKFAAKSHQQMVSTGQLKQIGCPYSGKAVDPTTMLDIGGASVFAAMAARAKQRRPAPKSRCRWCLAISPKALHQQNRLRTGLGPLLTTWNTPEGKSPAEYFF